MNFKLYGKVLEAVFILLIVYFSLVHYNNFMIFYKNFQNKNLLFKTTEYQNLQSLHEKILLYSNYLERNFIKPKNRKEALFFNEDKFTNEDFNKINKQDYFVNHVVNEKSFLNNAFTCVSDYFKSENSFAKLKSKRKTFSKNNNIKNNLIKRKSFNSSILANNVTTVDNLVNETYFIFNIEDRAFNAILSHNISEIFKSYMLLVVYFLLKVKSFLKSGR